MLSEGIPIKITCHYYHSLVYFTCIWHTLCFKMVCLLWRTLYMYMAYAMLADGIPIVEKDPLHVYGIPYAFRWYT